MTHVEGIRLSARLRVKYHLDPREFSVLVRASHNASRASREQDISDAVARVLKERDQVATN